MKGFLLAAGHGTRLRPLTDSIPKCLVPIRGVPLLKIWFDICRKFGIDELLINVHAHSAAIEEFARHHGSDLMVRIVEEFTLLGSAGTLLANRKWVEAEEAFWVIYADVLTRADLGCMTRFHQNHTPVATLGAYRVPDPQRCGIVSLDRESRVVEFVEKPTLPVSDLAFAGVMIAKPELLDAIPPKPPTDIGFDVLPRLRGSMLGYVIEEYLLDVGTMENYQAAQRTWPGL